MSPKSLADAIETLIPGLAGIYISLKAWGVIGPRPGSDLKNDEWMNRWGRRMRILGPLLILFAFFLLCSAILRSDMPEQWQTYKTAGFSVELPSSPVPDNKTVSVQGEVSVTEGCSLDLRGGRVTYIASSSNILSAQLPENAILDRVAEELSRITKAKLLARQDITMDGLPGVELRLAPEGSSLRTLVRICIANHRIFRIIAVVPESEVDAPSHRRVLESFHILKI